MSAKEPPSVAGSMDRRQSLKLVAATAAAFVAPSLLAELFFREIAAAPDEPSRRALSIALRRGHCAPSIMEASLRVGDPHALPLLKLVAGFPGGIGNHGAECGGLTAATVYLGLTLGGDDGSAIVPVVDAGRRYARHFDADHGASDCRVLERDMSNCLRVIATSPGLVKRCASECTKLTPIATESSQRSAVLARMQQGHFHCAHDLFTALDGVVTVDALTRRASCGFVGGTLMLGKTCSALTAGVMAIGQRLGAIESSRLKVLALMARLMRGDDELPDDLNAFHPAIHAAHRLVARFVDDHGTTSCRDLLRVDLGTGEGCVKYLARDMLPSCRKTVANVALRVREVLTSADSGRQRRPRTAATDTA
jgi:hypothetical protein